MCPLSWLHVHCIQRRENAQEKGGETKHEREAWSWVYIKSDVIPPKTIRKVAKKLIGGGYGGRGGLSREKTSERRTHPLFHGRIPVTWTKAFQKKGVGEKLEHFLPSSLQTSHPT
jgi:hypothetical protein